MTPHRARQPSLPPASSTPHILSCKILHIFWFEDMNRAKLNGGQRETDLDMNRHTCHCCLISLFYTLHSSTDGLSIDFDLLCLSLAVCEHVCACMVWGLYNYYSYC